MIAEKKAFKWEITIKMRNSYQEYFKNPMYLEIKCQLLNDGCTKTPQQGKLENIYNRTKI